MNHHLIYDAQLLDALRANDTTAFEKLFDRYWLRLFQYASSKLYSEEEAKEIVRDVFIDLWENRFAISPDFSLIGYLCSRLRKRVVGNLYRQICEKRIEYTRKNLLLTEFSVQYLKSAYRPVSLKSRKIDKLEEVSEDFRYPLLYMLKKVYQYSRDYFLQIVLHDIPARFSKTFL